MEVDVLDDFPSCNFRWFLSEPVVHFQGMCKDWTHVIRRSLVPASSIRGIQRLELEAEKLLAKWAEESQVIATMARNWDIECPIQGNDKYVFFFNHLNKKTHFF